jgi:TolB protein
LILRPICLAAAIATAGCGEPPRGATAIEASSSFRGSLAFQSDRDGNWEIYIVEADGTNLKRLTNHPTADLQPAWSPDGRFLAFSSERTGAGDIYLLDVEGGSLRQLTDHPAQEGAPQFSRDGRFLAFEGERDGRAEIYRLELATGAIERVTSSLTRKLGPAHSPDGTKLAFMENVVLYWQITVLDRMSGESRAVTGVGGSCRPAWSPDGKLLAYVSTRATPKAEVWFREMEREREGKAWMVRTREDAHNYDPSFSPDGNALALASSRERGPAEQWDLFLADVNGRKLFQLTRDAGNNRFPDWRPVPSR